MNRKKLVTISSFFIMMSFASVTYAGNCPSDNCFPVKYLDNLWQQSQTAQI